MSEASVLAAEALTKIYSDGHHNVTVLNQLQLEIARGSARSGGCLGSGKVDLAQLSGWSGSADIGRGESCRSGIALDVGIWLGVSGAISTWALSSRCIIYCLNSQLWRASRCRPEWPGLVGRLLS